MGIEDSEIEPARQLTKQRRMILDRMRGNDSEPHAARDAKLSCERSRGGEKRRKQPREGKLPCTFFRRVRGVKKFDHFTLLAMATDGHAESSGDREKGLNA